MLSSFSSLIRLLLLASSHPVSIVCCILAQTAIVSMMVWFYSSTRWFSFILFLIFVGGLIVLFVYIVSLASNEKFNLLFNGLIVISSLILMILFFSGLNRQDLLIETKFESSILLVNKIYSVNAAPLILITIIYLLYTLIVVVKIIETFEGPLRSLI